MSVNETVEKTDPVDTSVGGVQGHLLRRSVHLSMILIPWAYYWHGESIADELSLSKEKVLSIVMFAIILAESVRLKLGFTIFGQREYEAKQVSALAWGGLAIGLTLFIAPGKEFGVPLIISLALIDPLLGELRRTKMPVTTINWICIIATLVIWLACWQWLGTTLWVGILLSPVIVASEYPRLRWIDDNATMLLIPLSLIVLLSPWI